MSTSALKTPDVEAIMTRIREEVKASLADGRLPVVPQYQQKQAQLFSAAANPSAISPVLYSEELSYLNAHWHNWNAPSEISSHRRFFGPIIVKVKKLFVRFLWDSLLKNYFEQEREFQMHLVRHLNAAARYIDARDADIFWQLVHKIDHDIEGVSEQATRLFDQGATSLGSVTLELSQRIEKQENSLGMVEQIKKEVASLDELLRGLERTLAFLGNSNGNSNSLMPEVSTEHKSPREQQYQTRNDSLTSHESSQHDGEYTNSVSPQKESAYGEKRYQNNATKKKAAIVGCHRLDYFLFENRYRGSEEVIKRQLQEYIPFFKNASNVVVELGCGRGEFLELLQEGGIPAVGIDVDEAMIHRCHQKKLPAILADALTYLEQLDDRSIGGLFAAQLIEHLSREDLEHLVELASRKVQPGGAVLFETINPQSFAALACNFFRDPTHIWPLHPDTLRFMFEMKGMKTSSVLMRSPYPAEAILQPIPISEHLPARWHSMLASLNDNVLRLNHFLFGFQDYCIVGVVQNHVLKGIGSRASA